MGKPKWWENSKLLAQPKWLRKNGGIVDAREGLCGGRKYGFVGNQGRGETQKTQEIHRGNRKQLPKQRKN